MSMASETYAILKAPESGNYRLDNDRGKQFARDLMQRMSEQEAPFMLGSVAKAIAEKGCFGGIEIGFFHEIAATLLRAQAADTLSDDQAR